MDKLPGLQATKQSLGTHTGLAELVKERIDDEVCSISDEITLYPVK